MADFTITRRTQVDADPARVHGLINDFRQWPQWSPWESPDDDLERDYSGAAYGVGSHYAWHGNRKAGEGAVEITGSTPERIEIALRFYKPWKADNRVDFDIAAHDGGSDVAWTMHGENRGVSAVLARLLNLDRLLGRDFEKGLARLKAIAES